MSNLTDKQKLELSSAGFTDREITLYRQKFYNLLNTQPVMGFDVMRNLEGFRDQRDELLSALKGLLSLHEPEGRFQPSHYKPFLRKASAAIAKVDPGYRAAKAYEETQDLVEQRDQLLDSLKQIIGACDECAKDDSTSIVDTFTQKMEDDARALILKIDGGSPCR